MQPPAPHYQSHNTFPGSSYQNSSYNYPPSYNYYAPHAYSSATPRNYPYPQYGGSYDSQYAYTGYGNQTYAGANIPTTSAYASATSSYVPPVAGATVAVSASTAATHSSTTPVTSTPSVTNYGQWNWSK